MEKANHIHTYDSLSIGSLWNAYRTDRIYLLQHLIQGASHLVKAETYATRTSIPQLVHRLTAQRKALADDICASVSYMLGEIDQQANLRDPRQSKAIGGLLLLWPLGSLLYLNFLPTEQNAWIKERLAFIRDVHGIQQVKVVLSLTDS